MTVYLGFANAYNARMDKDPDSISSMFPAPPTLQELWWVAVEGAVDASGGWLILADPGDRGIRQIQTAFDEADIAVLAAVDAQSLHRALGSPSSEGAAETSVAFRRSPDGLHASVHQGGPADTLMQLRLDHPDDVLVLVESQDDARALDRRLQQLASSGEFEGVRMDLRDEPRGKGAWGLALVRSR